MPRGKAKRGKGKGKGKGKGSSKAEKQRLEAEQHGSRGGRAVASTAAAHVGLGGNLTASLSLCRANGALFVSLSQAVHQEVHECVRYIRRQLLPPYIAGDHPVLFGPGTQATHALTARARQYFKAFLEPPEASKGDLPPLPKQVGSSDRSACRCV